MRIDYAGQAMTEARQADEKSNHKAAVAVYVILPSIGEIGGCECECLLSELGTVSRDMKEKVGKVR